MTTAKSLQLTPLHLFFRRFAAWLVGLAMPHTLSGSPDALLQARRLCDQGCGLLLLINHFSFRDPLDVFRLVFQTPGLCRRPVVAPIAFHHWQRLRPMFRLLGWLTAVRLMPIVTSDTIEALAEDSPPLGGGMIPYLKVAVAALAAGQIVILAPQGGRRPQLGAPPGRPVAAILRSFTRQPSPAIALLPIGLYPRELTTAPGPADRGLHLFNRFRVTLGRPISLTGALDEAGNLQELDKWVFARLAELTPPAYHSPQQAG